MGSFLWVVWCALLTGSLMFDAPFSTYQRSRGTARVRLGSGGRLLGLFQQGSAKAMIPRTHGPSPEVVFLNTAGGLTGGDRLELQLDVAEGEVAMASTQTAERAYASPNGVAEVHVRLKVANRATLAWLPQETILFDRSGLSRRTEVSLEDGASFLGLETVVLGRSHMDETLTSVDFRDARRVFGTDGRILHAEQFAIDTSTLASRDGRAGLSGATVFSTLTWISPSAEDSVCAVRKLLPENITAAASAWEGRLVVRAMGDDSWELRGALIPVVQHLTGGHIPRVWQL